MRCAQCNEENAWTLAYCRNCGTPLAASASAGPAMRGEAPPASPRAPGTREAGPVFAFDARRWTAADRVTGGATLVLLVSLFLPWFGAGGGLFSVSLGGMWHGYMVIDLILAVAILGYLVALAGFSSLPSGLSGLAPGRLLAGAAGLNLLLAAASFVTKPAGTSWQYGAFVGLAAAIVAAGLPVRSVLAARHA